MQKFNSNLRIRQCRTNAIETILSSFPIVISTNSQYFIPAQNMMFWRFYPFKSCIWHFISLLVIGLMSAILFSMDLLFLNMMFYMAYILLRVYEISPSLQVARLTQLPKIFGKRIIGKYEMPRSTESSTPYVFNFPPIGIRHQINEFINAQKRLTFNLFL